MNPAFVYSLDRESFLGEYATRAEAVSAALRRADQNPTPVMTVYVGQRLSPDCRAFGHARTVIDRMRERVREDVGDDAAGFLRRLSDAQVTELDSALEKAILQWMNKHDLAPKCFKVEAIMEYPVPTAPSILRSGNGDTEVHLVGETRSML